jgi:glycosyltransferase involved in cell wall biosynthesis
MSAPRVGINLLWMIPGVVGGSETYTSRLLTAVLERGDQDLLLFVRPDFANCHPELAAVNEIVIAPGSGTSRGVRVGLENTWLPWAVKKAGVDLVHHPGGTLPWVINTPTVLTVHDLQPLTAPQSFSLLKRTYLGRAIPRSVRAADKVTVTSDYVAREMATHLGGQAGDYAVVPAGPGVVEPPPAAAAIAEVRARYGVGDRFAIYPAITYGHKNHPVLLRAAASLAGIEVVLTGGAGDAETEIAAYVAGNKLEGTVKRLGRIPRADLNMLLWGASALVFPSLHEGFGLPVIEAMARDLPVVVADASCLPDVAGEAGLVVAPHDVSGWVDAINRVVNEPELARQLVSAGRERTAAFASAEGGRRLSAAYLEVLER